VIHIDMYRLTQESELVEKWLLDAIMDYDYILIERPQWTEHYTDTDWISIHFTKDWNMREITITP
jgi:tRNA A37 threonylcarbamoyladenosine biosynthesis protein TsaE